MAWIYKNNRWIYFLYFLDHFAAWPVRLNLALFVLDIKLEKQNGVKSNCSHFDGSIEWLLFYQLKTDVHLGGRRHAVQRAKEK
jgi:hypothetical protein